MSTGKRPDWNLCVKSESETRWRKVGVAWTSDKGNISIRLDRGERGPDWTREGVMLFPYREERVGWQGGADRRPGRPTPSSDYMERKRQERRATPPPSPPPTAKPPLPKTPPGMDPDPEAPDWL